MYLFEFYNITLHCVFLMFFFFFFIPSGREWRERRDRAQPSSAHCYSDQASLLHRSQALPSTNQWHFTGKDAPCRVCVVDLLTFTSSACSCMAQQKRCSSDLSHHPLIVSRVQILMIPSLARSQRKLAMLSRQEGWHCNLSAVSHRDTYQSKHVVW